MISTMKDSTMLQSARNNKDYFQIPVDAVTMLDTMHMVVNSLYKAHRKYEGLNQCQCCGVNLQDLSETLKTIRNNIKYNFDNNLANN